MKLIVGLGNPETKYQKNRHNIGFMIVDHMADQYGATAFAKKFHGLFAKTSINGEDVGLLKPQTHMNLSGNSVQSACAFFKIKPEDIIVIHDELDIPFSQIKIKQGGGHGGHNGLRDIDAKIGKNYWRIRYGIDHPGDKHMVSAYVLSNFSKQEFEENEKIIALISTNINLMLSTPNKFTNKLSLERKK